ncbi:MAG: hypothetical protein FP825_06890 [Hyphomonas sp.]|uniref:hypothetical protein n=1 Tax=Hyphomonas sp. TaxID=87 RepID=UPI001806ACC6|nr:hypothetical protein [Hyphomonas sp.]MBA3068187.1 hypothetical protein [Hyphomonas sp.]MBU3919199.1 hypothetical protein [Alphaproteobacteria bacterium]MBU4062109.1 hypothetical protein [Alphaproteobacteria bacterium]MBU4165544.1 hypothetical protein [Alphaproteobacteria bacterium]
MTDDDFDALFAAALNSALAPADQIAALEELRITLKDDERLLLRTSWPDGPDGGEHVTDLLEKELEAARERLKLKQAKDRQERGDS